MNCFYCAQAGIVKEAVAKVGFASGNIWMAMLGLRAWNKEEIYVCYPCWEKLTEGKRKTRL